VINARLVVQSLGRRGQIIGRLHLQRRARCISLTLPMNSLQDLLRTERDQHANYDDPHLANEFAPAV
jgi:hypothetical protein